MSEISLVEEMADLSDDEPSHWPANVAHSRKLMDHIRRRCTLPESELHHALQSVEDFRSMNTFKQDGLKFVQWAVKCKREGELIRNLKKHGASLEPALRTAVTDPSLTAGERNKYAILLLSFGADPDAADEHGKLLDTYDQTTLFMKYFFDRARTCAPFRKMRQQLWRLEQLGAPSPEGGDVPRLARLPEVFFTLVGQMPAAHILVEKVVGWAFRLARQPKPLVLIFCGPSGHGKTELAQALCEQLAGGSEHFHKVPCDQMQTTTEIFGLGGAYQGAAEGSALNNFMRGHDGKPAVVLFDEFEKAEKGVSDSLLNIWDRGEWQDKKLVSGRNQTKRTDCTKTLFILTTNAFDSAVTEFEKCHPDLARLAGDRTRELEQKIDQKLRKSAQTSFSPSFAGRINSFVPFFSFAKGEVLPEQEVEVLIDKTVQDSFDFHVQKSKNGHCSIEVLADMRARLDFVKMAKHFYAEAEGVRSVKRCIERYISDPIENMWIQGDLDWDCSFLRMMVDPEAFSTSYRILPSKHIQQLRSLTPDERIEVCKPSVEAKVEWTAACDVLGVFLKQLPDGDLRMSLTKALLDEVFSDDEDRHSTSTSTNRTTRKKCSRGQKAAKKGLPLQKYMDRAPQGLRNLPEFA
mmetsp:Transcript_13175/g.23305  ORF Transcript_13175/g.23305 Transcript_13175/m.23305 type:complete len:633 (-) Transcript_13175:155-2053(-)